MNTSDKIALLIAKLRSLRLIGMADTMPELLERAAKKNFTTLEVLDRLCDEERQGRRQRAVERRIKQAHFPEVNTVDAFDLAWKTIRAGGRLSPSWSSPRTIRNFSSACVPPNFSVSSLRRTHDQPLWIAWRGRLRPRKQI